MNHERPPTMQITIPPPVAGRMEVLPRYLWDCEKKPAWFHRVMLRLLLGWKWKDYTQDKEPDG